MFLYRQISSLIVKVIFGGPQTKSIPIAIATRLSYGTVRYAASDGQGIMESWQRGGISSYVSISIEMAKITILVDSQMAFGFAFART